MERKPAKSFEDLIVWQKAHQLVLMVYRTSVKFPAHEIYGLRSQVRRAAFSVPANIAEGFKRRGKADKARILNIAQASLEETRYALICARDLEYCEISKEMSQLEEVSRLLESYTSSILDSGF